MGRVYLEETGKAAGYEHYHNDVFLGADKIGSVDYDKNQGLFISDVDFAGKRKRFYHPSLDGMTRKIDQWINKRESTDAKNQS